MVMSCAPCRQTTHTRVHDGQTPHSYSEVLTYFSRLFQVSLVADQHHRDVVSVANRVYQFLVLDGLLEAASVGDGVTDDEAFSLPHVLFPHSSEFRLQQEKMRLKALSQFLRHASFSFSSHSQIPFWFSLTKSLRFLWRFNCENVFFPWLREHLGKTTSIETRNQRKRHKHGWNTRQFSFVFRVRILRLVRDILKESVLSTMNLNKSGREKFLFSSSWVIACRCCGHVHCVSLLQARMGSLISPVLLCPEYPVLQALHQFVLAACSCPLHWEKRKEISLFIRRSAPLRVGQRKNNTLGVGCVWCFRVGGTSKVLGWQCKGINQRCCSDIGWKGTIFSIFSWKWRVWETRRQNKRHLTYRWIMIVEKSVCYKLHGQGCKENEEPISQKQGKYRKIYIFS